MIGQHRLRPANGLLGRLPNHHHGSVPLAFAFRQLPGDAHHHGHVQVMPASVHHADCLPLRVRCLHVACILQAGLLFNGQSIQLRTQQKPRPFAVFHHRDHALGLGAVLVFADMLSDCVSEFLQLTRYKSCRLDFVTREFRILMQMLVDLSEPG